MMLTLATLALTQFPDCLPDVAPDAPVTIDVAGVADPVEHEACHDLHSHLRNTHKPKAAVYLGGGKAALIYQPPFTLTDVAREVPTAERGMVFRLYLVDQARYWESEPCYVLDEAFAYVRGSEYHRLHSPVSSAVHSIRCAREFAAYNRALLRLARKVAKYDATQLAAVVAEHERQTAALEAK